MYNIIQTVLSSFDGNFQLVIAEFQVARDKIVRAIIYYVDFLQDAKAVYNRRYFRHTSAVKGGFSNLIRAISFINTCMLATDKTGKTFIRHTTNNYIRT